MYRNPTKTKPNEPEHAPFGHDSQLVRPLSLAFRGAIWLARHSLSSPRSWAGLHRAAIVRAFPHYRLFGANPSNIFTHRLLTLFLVLV